MVQTRTLGELGRQYGCEIHGDPATAVSRVATLAAAEADCIAFLSNPLYAKQLPDSGAGIVILQQKMLGQRELAALVAADPYLVYAQIAAELHPEPPLLAGVHPRAVIAEEATVAATSQVAAGAVIGSGAVIGERAYIGPNVCIGEGVTVGADSRLMANVSIYPGVSIGERCVFHSGAVIGARGFGLAKDATNGWINVPQLGSVVIGDDVEVGANSAIDRGAIDDTVIANGVKIDNLIQIGHNVKIGEHTALAGQAGVAGSTTIGARCLIGGAATINGHIVICDDVAVTGAAGITHSITSPGMYSGGIVPMDDVKSRRKNSVRFRQLDSIARRLKGLEKTVANWSKGEDSKD